MNILVTGGAGYIGSHTLVELIESGFKNIISIDNYSNSTAETYQRIKQITGVDIEHYELDLCNEKALDGFFSDHSFASVIHFAALKSVPESVEQPLLYYENNLRSLINLLQCMDHHKVTQIIFSSSCSVYGNPELLPVTESTPVQKTESPYANTKKIAEEILADQCRAKAELKAISLRYFNPVGAHASALLGELPLDRPNNLFPILCQVAAGKRKELTVFGDDYNTPDGSCIRDYIHVSDVAEAHVKALSLFDKMEGMEIINIGTGRGISTLEAARAFEKYNDIKLNYRIGNRRAGDVESIYANSQYARERMDWEASRDIEDMVKSAWKWQQRLK
jgi:UDP-glucose 4-epimerase